VDGEVGEEWKRRVKAQIVCIGEIFHPRITTTPSFQLGLWMVHNKVAVFNYATGSWSRKETSPFYLYIER
jgi:NADPH-dependent 2,4-dienoyl-CoA reductase/sulfur reductase-like enzyme